MRPAERYRFTLFWASVLVGLGVGVMAWASPARVCFFSFPSRFRSRTRVARSWPRPSRWSVRPARGRPAGPDRVNWCRCSSTSVGSWPAFTADSVAGRMSGRPSGPTRCGVPCRPRRAGSGRAAGRSDPPGRGHPIRRQELRARRRPGPSRAVKAVPPGRRPSKARSASPACASRRPRNRPPGNDRCLGLPC